MFPHPGLTSTVATVFLVASGAALEAEGSSAETSSAAAKVTHLRAASFRVVDRESGDVNYYKVIEDEEESFLRSLYQPPLETVVLAVEIPDRLRQRTKAIRWRWRALAMPKGGNECKNGYSDSAAVVYVTFRSGLAWYSLKYVWSSTAERGAVCDAKRGVFTSQSTIVLERGGPTADWRAAEIDPRADFRKHFANGDEDARVPDLVGIGIMSDGDQTNSLSSADFGGFTLVED